jgi:hypothetical protein
VRPAEEPGHPLESAFDDKPATWFRTTRNQSIRTGAHEWTIGFTERRLIDGIEIAPRSDEHWKHGQVRDYEIYVGDSNGEWGKPAAAGRLKLQKEMQSISFPAIAGRLLRFRVLSTQGAEGEGSEAANAAKVVNAMQPLEVGPIALSTFRILEHRAREGAEQQSFLSDLPMQQGVGRDRPAGKGKEMRMNGLWFRKGLGVGPASRIETAARRPGRGRQLPQRRRLAVPGLERRAPAVRQRPGERPGRRQAGNRCARVEATQPADPGCARRPTCPGLR